MILVLPELSLLIFSIFFLFMSITGKKGAAHAWAQVLSFLAFVSSLAGVPASGLLFGGTYEVELFSQVFKVLLAFGLCLVVFMFGGKDDAEEGYLPEYFMFLGLSVLGLMMLVSSVELISILISLEISSYSLYVIVPLRRGQGRIQLEAAVKYLFFGALATGVMLYGMGYLYGLTGSTFLFDIMLALPQVMTRPIGVFALVLTLAGFFFKLSLFPFHFWAPDVYEGASNSTTTFVATVPKLAAAALLIRLSMLAGPASPQVVTILTVLAGLSMTFGNLAGLVQKDVKRLLAYSGIAQAGYLILGLLPYSTEGRAAVIYYIAVYLFMNLACFYVLTLLSRTGENVMLGDLRGLARRAPLLAFTLAAGAFSLAGIPPTGGFTGKLFLFTSAFRGGYLAIVIIGAVNTAISIFYYLNLVRMSYSKDPLTAEPLTLTSYEKIVCYILLFLILYTGILPMGLFEFFKLAV
jgi:NADH-quinone oxidoreductase subunit N